MLEKISTSFGSTLSIKKTILLEMVKAAESRIVPENEQISEKDFISTMVSTMREFTIRMSDITERVSTLNDCIAKDRLPQYLKPGNNFLGKFQVDDFIPYIKIFNESLWT